MKTMKNYSVLQGFAFSAIILLVLIPSFNASSFTTQTIISTKIAHIFDKNFHLTAGSSFIDSGAPGSDLDPDSSRVDIGTYYYDQTSAKPNVDYFKINKGDKKTTDRMVALDNTCTENPTEYKAAENRKFTQNVKSEIYSSSPGYQLSKGYGKKKVYFKVKNEGGWSNTKKDIIRYSKPEKGKPNITYFGIKNGAESTSKRKVTLNSKCTGNPTHYRASEAEFVSLVEFKKEEWKPYSKAPNFTLSKSKGIKTVYFQIKNNEGESGIVCDQIYYGKSTKIITFKKTFGGPKDDRAYSVQQTSDGGYIIAGITQYQYGGFFGSSGDIWLIKTNSQGKKEWEKTFGDTGFDSANSVMQTLDGGYIIAGRYNSGDYLWLLKTDSNGNLLWERKFGETSGWIDHDGASDVKQTKDGGYIIVGFTNSYSTEGWDDIWVIKTNLNGKQKWASVVGYGGQDFAYSVDLTNDGMYIVAGSISYSVPGSYDDCLLKIKANGKIDWIKSFDRTIARSVIKTDDGGFITAGTHYSDLWLNKTDYNGNQLWEKRFEASHYQTDYDIKQTSEGGYIIVGSKKPSDAENYLFWLLKTDAIGNKLWEKTFGGDEEDLAYSVQQTSDGGYIIAGYTKSFGSGGEDVWLIKTDKNGNIK